MLSTQHKKWVKRKRNIFLRFSVEKLTIVCSKRKSDSRRNTLKIKRRKILAKESKKINKKTRKKKVRGYFQKYLKCSKYYYQITNIINKWSKEASDAVVIEHFDESFLKKPTSHFHLNAIIFMEGRTFSLERLWAKYKR